jgi:hypothetical protein
MDGETERGDGAPAVEGEAVGQCPACGPVSASATSRYCARHLAELRARWWVIRARKMAFRAA